MSAEVNAYLTDGIFFCQHSRMQKNGMLTVADSSGKRSVQPWQFLQCRNVRDNPR